MSSRSLTFGFLVAGLCWVGAALGNKEGVRIPVDEDLAPPLPPTEAGLDFIQAFFKSVAVIVVTELGDKTFFIAAVRIPV